MSNIHAIKCDYPGCKEKIIVVKDADNGWQEIKVIKDGVPVLNGHLCQIHNIISISESFYVNQI